MDKLTVEFEKDVPIPPVGRKAGTPLYPFGDLEPGDSMHIEVTGKDITRLQTAAHKYGQYHSQKFTTRKTDTGVRVWRIE